MTQSEDPDRCTVRSPLDATPEGARRAGGKPWAVLVIHGMGQQTRLSTLEAFSRGLLAALRRRYPTDGEGNGRGLRSEMALLDDVAVERLVLEVPGGVPRDVHLYEAWWAPLTEGSVRLRDVLSFLLRSGWRTVRHGSTRFDRWMFGAWRSFRIPLGSLLAVGATLALIIAGIALAVIGVAVALVTLLPGLGLAWPALSRHPALTTTLLALLLAVTATGGISLLAAMVRSTLTRVLSGASAALAGAALMVGTGVMLWQTITVESHLLFPALAGGWLETSWAVVPWVILLAVALMVRRMLVQYVGDVVVYLEAHRVDRFADLRSRIGHVVTDAARRVYGARSGAGSGSDFLYDNVIIAGHSLGSVLGYDVLNRLINLDALRSEQRPREWLDVAGRTRLLLTFGSPLDKTAWLFRMQSRARADAREALAALTQPLIVDRVGRPRWVNIYSRRDPIGGPLDYYDPPTGSEGEQVGGRAVTNRIDEEAWLPVMSHGQYWRTGAVFDSVLDALMETDPVRPPTAATP